MNTDIKLLYNLNINLDYFKKLKNYYYIPENKIKDVKLGGFVYLVDKYILDKKVYYKGYLVRNNEVLLFFFRDFFSISAKELLERYHFFYKPKLNKMTKALELVKYIKE
jgi:hypothetical protein